MIEDKMGTAETVLIAFFLFMSVVLGLVILWVARNLRRDPSEVRKALPGKKHTSE